jgi:hypothetical protein
LKSAADDALAIGCSSPRRLDFALVVLVSFSAIASNLWLRAPSVLSSDWLFREGAWVLNAATSVLNGHSLYYDIQWNYGPVPVYYYAGFAAAFGNSPTVFLFSNALIYALSLGFVYIATVKYLTRFQALMCIGLAGLPLVLAASIQGENTAPFEYLSISVIAALYETPRTRNWRLSFFLGAIAGASQWCKFGSGVVAAAAIVLLDLVAQWRKEDRTSQSAFFRNLTAGIVGFMSLEISREAFHFLTLPLPYALDATFPLYYKQWYASYITPRIRFPEFATTTFFIGVQLPILIGVCCGIGILLPGLLRRNAGNSRFSHFPYAVCVAPIYYCLGCVGYFRHVFHFLQYGFIVGIAAGYVLARSSGWVRVLLLASILPTSVNLIKGIIRDIHPGDRGLAYVALPNGSHLFLNLNDRKFIVAVNGVLNGFGIEPRGKPVVCSPNGEGFEFFLGLSRVGRHSHIENVLVRPFERAEYFNDVMACAGILFIGNEPLPAYVRNDPKGSALAVLPTFDPDQTRLLTGTFGQPTLIANRAVFIPINKRSAHPPFFP